MRRLPKYVHGFIDRQGRPRHYLRRPGVPKIALPGPAVVGAVHGRLPRRAEADGSSGRRTIVAAAGADRIVPRSLRALAVALLRSRRPIAQLKEISQGRYKSQIEILLPDAGPGRSNPTATSRPAGLQRKHIEALMARRADKPDAANMLRRMLREMMKVAIQQGWRDDDPTFGHRQVQAQEPQGLPPLDRRRNSGNSRTAIRSVPRGPARHGARPLHRPGPPGRASAMGAQHISREYDADDELRLSRY